MFDPSHYINQDIIRRIDGSTQRQIDYESIRRFVQKDYIEQSRTTNANICSVHTDRQINGQIE